MCRKPVLSRLCLNGPMQMHLREMAQAQIDENDIRRDGDASLRRVPRAAFQMEDGEWNVGERLPESALGVFGDAFIARRAIRRRQA